MPLLYFSIQPMSILNDFPDTAGGGGGFDPGEVAYISRPPVLEADAQPSQAAAGTRGPGNPALVLGLSTSSDLVLKGRV